MVIVENSGLSNGRDLDTKRKKVIDFPEQLRKGMVNCAIK